MAVELENVRIPQLPPKGTASLVDLVPIYDPADDTTKHVEVSTLLSAQTYDFAWQPDGDYDTDAVVIYADKLWRSLVDNNTGRIPTEGPYWTQVNKSPSSALVYWQAGVFGSGDIFVVANVGGIKSIYELLVSSRPFISSNFTTELAAGKWGLIGATTTGSTMAVYATIAARNTAATNGDLEANQIVRVTDATGDPTVTAGRAYYEYLGTGTSFNKISEEESLDLDFSTFTRNSTGETTLDITPTNASFFTGILTGGKAKLRAIIDFLVTKVGLVGTKDVDETNIGNLKILVYNSTSGKLEYLTNNGYFGTKQIDEAAIGAGKIPYYNGVSGKIEYLSNTMGYLGTKQVDETAIGNGKIPQYNSTTNKIEYVTPSSGGGSGLTSRKAIFPFNMDIYTSREQMFRGLISNLAGSYDTTRISGVSFQVKTTSTSYVDKAALSDVLTWIGSNISGNENSGTIFWINVIITPATGISGYSEYHFTYTPS